MEFPNIITDVPSAIELLIFEDEKAHFPFHIQCTPSEEYSITVKRYKNNIVVSQYKVLSEYNTNLNELLRSQGIQMKDGKWIITNDF